MDEPHPTALGMAETPTWTLSSAPSPADLDAFLGILPDADGGALSGGAQQVQDVLVVNLEAAEEQLRISSQRKEQSG